MSLDTRVRSLRDLLLVSTGQELVLACDSVGGIGPREADTYPADGRTSAHFAARVPLLEVLCAGARPIALINTLCQDKVSATPLIEEFRAIAAEAGIAPEAVTGSTEDNVETRMTGIGVVVVGALERTLLSGGAQDGDLVVCLGWPRSAPADHLSPGRADIVPISAVRTLVASGMLTDALPVGSGGLAWEVPQLARSADLRATWLDGHSVPTGVSGGPSSCVLVSCAPQDEDKLHALIDPAIPWTRVARVGPS